jgi:hypothetical protein
VRLPFLGRYPPLLHAHMGNLLPHHLQLSNFERICRKRYWPRRFAW